MQARNLRRCVASRYCRNYVAVVLDRQRADGIDRSQRGDLFSRGTIYRPPDAPIRTQ